MILLSKPKNPKFQRITKDIRWVERYPDGKIKKVHLDKQKIGFTLIISPYEPNLTYQTKPITKIIEKTKTLIYFQTEDCEYKLQYFE